MINKNNEKIIINYIEVNNYPSPPPPEKNPQRKFMTDVLFLIIPKIIEFIWL